MIDLETRPAGTADLVKRLRDYEEYEQSRDGQIICVKSDIAQEAAARIERLEAEVRELNMQVLASGSQAQEAYEAQIKAEAATAAIREAALREAAYVASRLGVYPELNVHNGGPEWYKHGKNIEKAILAMIGEKK